MNGVDRVPGYRQLNRIGFYLSSENKQVQQEIT